MISERSPIECVLVLTLRVRYGLPTAEFTIALGVSACVGRKEKKISLMSYPSCFFVYGCSPKGY